MNSSLPKQTPCGEAQASRNSDKSAEGGDWSAAITNFNGEALVCETIASIKQLEHPPSEILLVDDGSTDASLERVRDQHPDVRIVSLGQNTGVLNIVRNRGLHEARHRYVLIADSDITFAPDAVRHLMRTLQVREDAAACTPLIAADNGGGTLLAKGHRLHFLCWSTVPRAGTVEAARQLGEHKAVGCGIQLIDKLRAAPVGFFDEDLVLGWGDDGEFHFRLRLAGLACYSVPTAVVFHRRVRKQSRFYGQVHNRLLMMLKDFQWRTILVLAPAFLLFEPLLFLLLVVQGAGRDYGRALHDVARALPHALRQRRRVQAMRRLSDGEILSAGRLSAPARLRELTAIRAGLNALSIVLGIYWTLVRPLLVWRTAESVQTLPGNAARPDADGLASQAELYPPGPPQAERRHLLAALRRHCGEVQFEASCLLQGRYPRFVAASEPTLAADDVPVFVFHSIEPAEFEAQLRYLVDNGYQSLTCAAFDGHLRGERVPPRSVLLTIDDGRASVWSVGWPLLKKYGQTAVVFLIPGYISDGDEAGPTLEDVWSGRIAAEQLPRRDPALMTWREVQKAVDSGTLEVGSHTLYHHPVPVSDRIVGYVSPDERRPLLDLPVEPGREREAASGGLAQLYGLPIYESAPFLSGRACYSPDSELASRCIALVSAAGGAPFFCSPRWRAQLDQLVAEHRRRNGEHGRFLDLTEQRAAMVDDLRRSRELLEQRLGTPVRHLCFPYTAGSDLAVDAAKEAGYSTSFWGVLAERRSNRPGDDPYYCPRLKGDYVFRLPGRGRRTLARVVAGKALRRLSGAPVY